MKHLLLSLLIVSSVGVTAQSDLYVGPNGSTDSYVYVNDAVLYVENDVNLDKNASGSATEASIYLRNNGQLIQGNDTADNQGDGLLSVYRSVDSTSAYHYKFYNMPVGVTSGSGNSNAGVSRFFDCDGCGDTETAATAIGTTTGRNGSLNPTTLSTRWIYVKDPSPNNDNEANWRRINNNDVVSPFQGFIMKGVSTDPSGNRGTLADLVKDFKFDLRGRPNTGTLSINMPAGGEVRVVSGNPYPSAIDLSQFVADNNASGGPQIATIRFWDEPKDTDIEYSHFYADKSGGWGSWVPAGAGTDGVYTPPTFNNYSASGIGGSAGTGRGGLYSRRYSPIGQGFEILTDGTPGLITYSNSHRVFQREGANSIFKRPEAPENKIDKNTNNPGDESSTWAEADPRSPYLRINVVMHESYARQLVLGLDDRTTDNMDYGWDAPSPMDAKSGEAYFLIGDDSNRKPFVIQFVPYGKEKMIPIGFKLTKQTKFFVETVEEVKMHNKKAYIFDSADNTYQEFTNGKSATYNLDAGTYDDRFFVVFKGKNELSNYAKETQGRVEENVDFFQNNNLGVLEVQNPEGYNIKQALIFDMTGKLVYEKQNIGAETHFSFPTSNLSDGVYIVKLKTTDNIDISHKTSVYNRK
ncbi:T9SS type A sorting domain-containing protein [uncultured Marixanthomonas sp.]|uniref:T9SS type A sorting domain-containing protein n=1 Tax=uncultured Marixanthomonas sp. TaxID=757245 RepID=UPI0030D9B5FA|tara:strand:+ start:18713 stop:20623 length:1911 start_codon:yes stop_codon:yes gene_type:complete